MIQTNNDVWRLGAGASFFVTPISLRITDTNGYIIELMDIVTLLEGDEIFVSEEEWCITKCQNQIFF